MTAFFVSALFLVFLQPAPVSLASLKDLGEFAVTFEGEPLESFPLRAPCVYYEFAAGYKTKGRWAERFATRHSGKPVTVVTPRGRLEAPFSTLRLYLPVSASRRYSRKDAATAPELIRSELATDGRTVLVEEIVLVTGRTYRAKVDTVSYLLPPERPEGQPSRHEILVLAVSDVRFRKGKPRRPLTPAYEGLTF